MGQAMGTINQQLQAVTSERDNLKGQVSSLQSQLTEASGLSDKLTQSTQQVQTLQQQVNILEQTIAQMKANPIVEKVVA
jgi:SMC interacting uncharacterized protein involved in chromosome segregation